MGGKDKDGIVSCDSTHKTEQYYLLTALQMQATAWQLFNEKNGPCHKAAYNQCVACKLNRFLVYHNTTSKYVF